jgi:hypothetical protein
VDIVEKGAPVSAYKNVPYDEYVAAREKSARKMFLTPYTAEQLAEMGAKVWLTADGVGFALKPDGDIIGVFNNSGRPGAGQDALIMAIAEGDGRKAGRRILRVPGRTLARSR